MASNPQTEPEYIRQFAKVVRGGTSSKVWRKYAQQIRAEISNIKDSKIRGQAEERFVKIDNYIFFLREEDSRNLIADDIEKFADFMSNII